MLAVGCEILLQDIPNTGIVPWAQAVCLADKCQDGRHAAGTAAQVLSPGGGGVLDFEDCQTVRGYLHRGLLLQESMRRADVKRASRYEG